MAQHNANADVVANMENSLRVCILPKPHTPDGAAGYDAFVFDDSNDSRRWRLGNAQWGNHHAGNQCPRSDSREDILDSL